MSREVVPVARDEDDRYPDYDGSFVDAVYWNDDDPIADDLAEGEVSIIKK